MSMEDYKKQSEITNLLTDMATAWGKQLSNPMKDKYAQVLCKYHIRDIQQACEFFVEEFEVMPKIKHFKERLNPGHTYGIKAQSENPDYPGMDPDEVNLFKREQREFDEARDWSFKNLGEENVMKYLQHWIKNVFNIHPDELEKFGFIPSVFLKPALKDLKASAWNSKKAIELGKRKQKEQI